MEEIMTDIKEVKEEEEVKKEEEVKEEEEVKKELLKTIDNNNNIPKVIYICHKNIECLKMTCNLWKKLNPTYKINLFDNSMCEKFLLTEFSILHYNIFKYIPDGPIKADFWRLCIIYKYGGIYVDADIHPLIPLNKYLILNSDFVTCITEATQAFNPHFIASKKNNIILKMCIDEYLHLYTTRGQYSYERWSIVRIFGKFLNHVRNSKIKTITVNNNKFQFFVETRNANLPTYSLHDYYCTFNNLKIFNTRYLNYDSNSHEFKKYIVAKTSVFNKSNIINKSSNLKMTLSGSKGINGSAAPKNIKRINKANTNQVNFLILFNSPKLF